MYTVYNAMCTVYCALLMYTCSVCFYCVLDCALVLCTCSVNFVLCMYCVLALCTEYRELCTLYFVPCAMLGYIPKFFFPSGNFLTENLLVVQFPKRELPKSVLAAVLIP